MSELVVAQHPPFGEMAAKPIFQWGHAEIGEQRPVVSLAGGLSARTPAHPLQLAPGSQVRIRVDGHWIPAVVQSAVSHGRRYVVTTATSPKLEVPAGSVLPDDGTPPLPSARPWPLVASELGLRTPWPARLRLRWALEEYLVACSSDGLGGATWLDAAVLPHQLAVVHRVLTSPSIRHLLTDEVGLGKTVEALMIWCSLRAQEPCLSTLIACPRALIPQWSFEVQRRAEHPLRGGELAGLPRIFVDEAELESEVLDPANPERPVLLAHDALEVLARRGLAVGLLIIDESHLLNAKEREAAERLAGRAKHLLLLTATPREARRRTGVRAQQMRTELTPFLWALRLVDPKVPSGADAQELGRRLDAALRLGAQAQAYLSSPEELSLAMSFVQIAAAELERDGLGRVAEDSGPMREVLVGANARAELRTPLSVEPRALTQEVARRVTVFERVVRTRRKGLPAQDLSSRQLSHVTVEPRAEELLLLRQLTENAEDEAEEGVPVGERARRVAASGWRALSGATRRLAPSLRESLAKLRGGRVDSKVEALFDLLSEIWADAPNRKVVIRAQYADTRALLYDRLRALLLQGGLRSCSPLELSRWSEEGSTGPVALLEDSQDSIVELLRPAAAGPVEDLALENTMLAQLHSFESFHTGCALVLLANDVAGTGLNLQFSSDLVLFDLPWRPQQVEQWIGRLDRLGRSGQEAVRVHVLSHRVAPDWQLLGLYERLDLFGAGFHVPPEVADTIDRLIDQADAGRVPWAEALQEAQDQLTEAEQESPDDTLLDVLEPQRSKGVQLRAQACLISERSVRKADALREAMTGAGLLVKPDPKRRSIVRVELVRDDLGLKELRQVLRPRHHDPMKPPPTLELDLSRLPMGRPWRGSAAQFFSPQHPVIRELQEELRLEAGGTFGVFSLRAPPALASFAGRWAVLCLVRSFPAAAATAALWGCGALQGLADEELLGICEAVRAGLARSLTCLLAPEVASGGFVASGAGGELALTETALSAEQVNLLLEMLPGAQFEQRLPFKNATEVLSAVERRLNPGGGDAPGELRERLADLRAFIEVRRRGVVMRRAATVEQWQARLNAAPANTGFQTALRNERERLHEAEEVFTKLSRLGQDPEVLRRDATRRHLAVAALIQLRSGR